MKGDGIRQERTKRIWTTIIAVALVMTTIGSVALAVQQHREKGLYQQDMANLYEDTFYNLKDSLEALEDNLAKLKAVGNDAYRSVVLNEIWRYSGIAEESMGKLPMMLGPMESTHAFINRLGDYAYQMGRLVAEQKSESDVQQAQWASLYEHCRALNDEMQQLYARIQAGNIDWLALYRASETDGQLAYINDGFDKMETQSMDLAALQYDGPFSEQLLSREPKGLGVETVTAEQAEYNLREYLQRSGTVTLMGETEGRIPGYQFSFTLEDGADGMALMSRQGGKLVQMLGFRGDMGETELDVRTCEAKAVEYAKSIGIDAVAVYSRQNECALITTLAPIQDGIVVYTDQFNINICACDGAIMGVDMQLYVMNHVPRTWAEIGVSEQQTREKAAARIEAKQVRLAMIPLQTGKEVLCWEVIGAPDEQGRVTAIYYNVISGKEEYIYRSEPNVIMPAL